MARRILLLSIMIMAAISLVAGPAAAVHEANNQFDMAAVGSLPDADARGISNYSAGSEGWNNQVRASGLEPSTTYTWVGIAMGRASEICTFTTDASGVGGCRSTVNSRLGATEIREGGVEGLPVLGATASTDDDNTVEDGEIERRGNRPA